MYYKVLDKNNQAIYQGFDYTPYLDGTWTPRVKDTIICKRGYHGTTKPMEWPLIGMRVYALKYRGGGDAGDGGKRVFESISIQEEHPELVPQWWHDVEDFVAGLKDIPWGVPQCEPKDNWVVCGSRDAAWSAGYIVWDAARRATRDAAWDAAREDARRAAWDAAREDACLMASLLVCQDLDIPQKHIDYIKGEWDVRANGYGCAGYKDGKYLVYKIGGCDGN